MGDKSAKLLRSQLRNIVKEILPELLSNEMFAKLQEQNYTRLNTIADEVRQTLQNIDSRTKDVQGLIMREAIAARAPVTAPAPEGVKIDAEAPTLTAGE